MKNLQPVTPWLILGIYWPVLFLCTHIPRPPHLQIFGRDVTLHFVAYFFLTLLFWIARYGSIKPSFKKTGFYFTLIVIALYGAADELSQVYVHRHCDFIDWLSDIGGCLFALALLFIVRRLIYWLIIYWLCLFTITHWPYQMPLIKLPLYWQRYDMVLVMMAYLTLTLLWWRSACPRCRFVFNWKLLISTLIVIPTYLLLDLLLRKAVQRPCPNSYFLYALAGIFLAVLSALFFARHHVVAKSTDNESSPSH